MKYECILKIKNYIRDQWTIKYKCIMEHWEETAKNYEEKGKKYFDYLIQINELDDDGEFNQVII